MVSRKNPSPVARLKRIRHSRQSIWTSHKKKRDEMSACRSINLTRVNEWKDGSVHSFQDYLVAEEPLEIRVNGNPLTVTMRTPGHDIELTAGLLFTEGVVRRADQIMALRPISRKNKSNEVEVRIKD